MSSMLGSRRPFRSFAVLLKDAYVFSFCLSTSDAKLSYNFRKIYLCAFETLYWIDFRAKLCHMFHTIDLRVSNLGKPQVLVYRSGARIRFTFSNFDSEALCRSWWFGKTRAQRTGSLCQWIWFSSCDLSLSLRMPAADHLRARSGLSALMTFLISCSVIFFITDGGRGCTIHCTARDISVTNA